MLELDDEVTKAQRELETSVTELIIDVINEQFFLTKSDLAIIERDACAYSKQVTKYATDELRKLLTKVMHDLYDD